ncbi:MAG TPA: UbiA family prenyltransferase [Planctomycetota bacterium]|nr:UbiA family prenyltransferase [Planctomycetota bacterium]
MVLAPLVFAGRLKDPAALRAALLMAAAFCLLASGGYALNDLRDEPADRLHPAKAGRPLPSGALPRRTALGLGLLCIATGLGLGWVVQRLAPPVEAGGLAAVGPLGWCVVYLALSGAYTLWLRAVAGLDVLALAAAFVLRAYAGSAALQLLPSHWLVACGACLALFLALGKRRLEISQVGAAARPALATWDPAVLDRLLDLSALAAAVSYVVYTVVPATAARVGGPGLLASAPLVAWLLVRARGRVRRDAASDPVELLLRDRPTLLGFVAWTIVVLAVIYRHP